MYAQREGAEPQEGRQSRERPAAFVARQTLETPPESGTVGSALGRRVGRAWAACRPQGDGGESPGGANTQEGKVRRPRFRFPGIQARRSPPRAVFLAQRLTPLELDGPTASAAGAGRWLTPPGSRTDKPLNPRRLRPCGEAGERKERRGPERGAAVRGEQGPEGRTPGTLRSRRASPGAAGSKPSRR
jgi:hypothetical protein